MSEMTTENNANESHEPDEREPHGEREGDRDEGTRANEDDEPHGNESSRRDWEAEARKWEKRAKENRNAAKRLADIERANETEQEKLARERDEARSAAESSAVELARMRAGMRYGLTEDDLELLGSGSPDEIDERAKRLADRLGAAATKPPASRRPAERLRGGSEPEREPEETDLAKLGARMFRH